MNATIVLTDADVKKLKEEVLNIQDELENQKRSQLDTTADLNKKHEELTNTLRELDKTKTELDNEKEAHVRANFELEQTKQNLDQVKTDIGRKDVEAFQLQEELQKQKEINANTQKRFEQTKTTLANAIEDQNTKTDFALSEIEKQKLTTYKLSSEFKAIKEQLTKVQEEQKDRSETNARLASVVEKIDQIRRKQEKQSEFKTKLLEVYEETCSTLPLAPMLEECDAKLLKFYVIPAINEETKDRKTTAVPTIQSMLCVGGQMSKKIYLVGEAGAGKTAFCKYFTMLWCAFQKDDTEALERIQTIVSKSDICTDYGFLNQFDYVFRVQLREDDMSNGWVEDIIRCCVVQYMSKHTEYDNEFIDSLLSEYQCLVLLDGLDEWGRSRVPKARARNNCTVLTTMRPFRLSEKDIKRSEQEKNLSLTGIKQNAQEYLIEYATDCLNKETKKQKVAKDFKEALQSFQNENRGVDAFRTPIVILQLLCLWHDDREFGKSLCSVYGNVLDMLFGRAVEKYGIDVKINADESSRFLPACLRQHENIYQFAPVAIAMGRLAFYTLFSSGLQDSVIFKQSYVSEHLGSKELLTIALKTGLISRSASNVVSKREYNYSFVHKSYQEMLCALYMASVVPGSDDYVALTGMVNAFAREGHSLPVISKVFEFLCGMNFKLAGEITNIFDVQKPHLHACQSNFLGICKGCSYQNCLFLGYEEAINNQNGHDDIKFSCRHVVGSGDKFERLNVLLSICNDSIVTLDLQGTGNLLLPGKIESHGQLDCVPFLPCLSAVTFHSLKISNEAFLNVLSSLFSFESRSIELNITNSSIGSIGECINQRSVETDMLLPASVRRSDTLESSSTKLYDQNVAFINVEIPDASFCRIVRFMLQSPNHISCSMDHCTLKETGIIIDTTRELCHDLPHALSNVPSVKLNITHCDIPQMVADTVLVSALNYPHKISLEINFCSIGEFDLKAEYSEQDISEIRINHGETVDKAIGLGIELMKVTMSISSLKWLMDFSVCKESMSLSVLHCTAKQNADKDQEAKTMSKLQYVGQNYLLGESRVAFKLNGILITQWFFKFMITSYIRIPHLAIDFQECSLLHTDSAGATVGSRLCGVLFSEENTRWRTYLNFEDMSETEVVDVLESAQQNTQTFNRNQQENDDGDEEITDWEKLQVPHIATDKRALRPNEHEHRRSIIQSKIRWKHEQTIPDDLSRYCYLIERLVQMGLSYKILFQGDLSFNIDIDIETLLPQAGNLEQRRSTDLTFVNVPKDVTFCELMKSVLDFLYTCPRDVKCTFSTCPSAGDLLAMATQLEKSGKYTCTRLFNGVVLLKQNG